MAGESLVRPRTEARLFHGFPLCRQMRISGLIQWSVPRCFRGQKALGGDDLPVDFEHQSCQGIVTNKMCGVVIHNRLGRMVLGSRELGLPIQIEFNHR